MLNFCSLYSGSSGNSLLVETENTKLLIDAGVSSKKIETALTTQQAVTDTKLEELTREVRAHNNFAQRVPVLEEQMKVANHRIEDLERK